MSIFSSFKMSREYVGKTSRFMDKHFHEQLISDKYVKGAQGRLVQAIQAEAPVGPHFDPFGNAGANEYGEQGELRDSIYAVTYHQHGQTQIAIITKSDHAKYVIGGTKAHIIQSTGDWTLQFWWERLGARFPDDFLPPAGDYTGDGKTVAHPGTKPNDFAIRAWQKMAKAEVSKFKLSITSQLK